MSVGPGGEITKATVDGPARHQCVGRHCKLPQALAQRSATESSLRRALRTGSAKLAALLALIEGGIRKKKVLTQMGV